MNGDDSEPSALGSLLATAIAPPALIGLALAVNFSPLVFLLKGFHVWMHEFGHSTVAWLTGHRALPLPIGWSNIEAERSLFVYFGVLFLLGLFVVAGWRERKVWPLILGSALAGVQAYMTWRMPEDLQREWEIFAGVGGQFYLSALLMAAFFLELPEKFQWEKCRYLVFFIAASCFVDAYVFWGQVHRGLESIPWGSMINGEGDGGGDMNILRDEYQWSNHRIIGTYFRLGQCCVGGLILVYGLAVMEACGLRIPLPRFLAGDVPETEA